MKKKNNVSSFWVYCRGCGGDGCTICESRGGHEEDILEEDLKVPLCINESLFELKWLNLSQKDQHMSLKDLYDLIIEKSNLV